LDLKSPLALSTGSTRSLPYCLNSCERKALGTDKHTEASLSNFKSSSLSISDMVANSPYRVNTEDM